MCYVLICMQEPVPVFPLILLTFNNKSSLHFILADNTSVGNNHRPLSVPSSCVSVHHAPSPVSSVSPAVSATPPVAWPPAPACTAHILTASTNVYIHTDRQAETERETETEKELTDTYRCRYMYSHVDRYIQMQIYVFTYMLINIHFYIVIHSNTLCFQRPANLCSSTALMNSAADER